MTKEFEIQLKKFVSSKKDREINFSRYSHARLGLGHTGGHLKHTAWLDLQADFAEAKDAVFSSFDNKELIALCHDLNLSYLT
ncbi:MAG: ethanolamine ammonia-lyase light chain EutC, partial [Gammaproteobacteria bacterium]|nr:ethanolamine ammonia-lyase light chain EutC [Gammaproteobacteria bacterium]